jgi:hypothetical protein
VLGLDTERWQLCGSSLLNTPGLGTLRVNFKGPALMGGGYDLVTSMDPSGPELLFEVEERSYLTE